MPGERLPGDDPPGRQALHRLLRQRGLAQYSLFFITDEGEPAGDGDAEPRTDYPALANGLGHPRQPPTSDRRRAHSAAPGTQGCKAPP
jgi:hypothetical protein